METTDSFSLFLALSRRLERLQSERRTAWLMGEASQEAKLSKRCQRLIAAIFNISLS